MRYPVLGPISHADRPAKASRIIGSPRRTIATAQVLYHRFHLFFPLKDFAYQVRRPEIIRTSIFEVLTKESLQDVSIAALLVASKLEDTLKKLRDVQIAAYQVKAAQDGVTAIMEPDQQVRRASYF